MSRLFITATDTDAGKTYIAKSLVRSLVKQGNKVAVYKPISAGCYREKNQLINEDAFLLQQQANCEQTLAEVNPIAFELPIAPHIAAQKEQKIITLDEIYQGYLKVLSHQADVTVCEGAGGWRLPLGQGKFLSEFVKETQQQVLLVVNIKLGCLNHAVLTYESIINDGVSCIAWLANVAEKDTCSQRIKENIHALTELLPIPMLTYFEHQLTESPPLFVHKELELIINRT